MCCKTALFILALLKVKQWAGYNISCRVNLCKHHRVEKRSTKKVPDLTCLPSTGPKFCGYAPKFDISFFSKLIIFVVKHSTNFSTLQKTYGGCQNIIGHTERIVHNTVFKSTITSIILVRVFKLAFLSFSFPHWILLPKIRQNHIFNKSYSF